MGGFSAGGGVLYGSPGPTAQAPIPKGTQAPFTLSVPRLLWDVSLLGPGNAFVK